MPPNQKISPEAKRKIRFTDGELEMFKSLFAENDALLFLIRKSMLQFTLTADEKSTLKSVINDSVRNLFKKAFVPDLDWDAPLFELTDLILGLGEIKNLSPEGAWPLIKAKEIEINYLRQQLLALTSDLEAGIRLSELGSLDGDKEEVYTNILARNWLLAWIDSNLQQMWTLAGLKTETVEETKKRLARDSNK